MNPSSDEPDDEKAAEAVREITLEEQINELGLEILESARRMATDPEHRAMIRKLLV